LTYLIGPEAQEIFFKASDDVLSQNEVYDFMRPVFGNGIVYDATKKNRQVQFTTMSAGLKTQRLKSYVTKIEQETRKYLDEYWNLQTGEVDILTALSEITILTASRCLHGDDVRTHIFKDVQALYHDLDHGLTPLTVFWPDAPTSAHAKRNAARKAMVSLFEKVIRDRRSNPSGSDGTDILSLFMDIVYKDGTPISTEEVTGLLIALLFAGQHTSCITSTWTSLFIANDPKLMSAIMEEQEQVLLKSEGGSTVNTDLATVPLDYEAIQQMELLHNCIRESLRMCPTFIMILRRAEKNIPIEFSVVQERKEDKKQDKKYNYTIPKGDFVVVSPTVSMRLETSFPCANTYDPYRFSEANKIKPYSYLGFGGGVHSCMGQNFAFVQLKTVISVILRSYHIERLSKDMPAVGYNDMVVGPVGNTRVKYTKKSAQ
jgi:sterol 14alpha-demethylase